MFCPKCGVQLVSDTTPLCAQCGSPVKASAQAPVQAAGGVQSTFPVAGPGKRKNGSKLWLWGALVGFVVLGSAALYISPGGSVKGSWPTSNSRLDAANAGAGTPTPQTATGVPRPSEPAVEQGDSAAISVVKNGVLANYNTTTVGKALEGTLQNSKWKSFVSPKGTTVVEFDGTVKPKVLTESGLYIPESSPTAKTAITNCMDTLSLKEEMTQEAHQGDYWHLSVVYWMLHTRPERVDKLNECLNLPVSFQFALSADKETLSLAYIDQMFSDQGEKVMNFIYH